MSHHFNHSFTCFFQLYLSRCFFSGASVCLWVGRRCSYGIKLSYITPAVMHLSISNASVVSYRCFFYCVCVFCVAMSFLLGRSEGTERRRAWRLPDEKQHTNFCVLKCDETIAIIFFSRMDSAIPPPSASRLPAPTCPQPSASRPPPPRFPAAPLFNPGLVSTWPWLGLRVTATGEER